MVLKYENREKIAGKMTIVEFRLASGTRRAHRRVFRSSNSSVALKCAAHSGLHLAAIP